jgi:hypothetical protein
MDGYISQSYTVMHFYSWRGYGNIMECVKITNYDRDSNRLLPARKENIHNHLCGFIFLNTKAFAVHSKASYEIVAE